jgi:hypothetical protein
MEILNKNTFSDENVAIEKNRKGDTLIYIGKACYSLNDLEKVVSFAKTKDLNESLNYRVKNFIK